MSFFDICIFQFYNDYIKKVKRKTISSNFIILTILHICFILGSEKKGNPVNTSVCLTITLKGSHLSLYQKISIGSILSLKIQ